MFERCNDLFRVLKYMLFNQGCTIDEIAAAIGITSSYVIKIILSVYDEPMKLFKLTYYCIDSETQSIDVFTDLKEKQLITKVKWYIDTTNMDIIPIKNFDNHEKKLLEALIMLSILPLEVSDITAKFKEENYKQLDTLFLYDIPYNNLMDTKITRNLKMAIQGRKFVKIFFYESHHFKYIKPLGFLHNEQSGEWSLICQEELQVFKAIPLSKMEKAEISHRVFSQGIPLNLDLVKAHLGAEEIDIELIIENHETVLDKLKKQLGGKGEFSLIDGGRHYFKGNIQNIRDFKIIIMRMGSSVQVVVPEELRREIIEDAKVLAKMHEKEACNEFECFEDEEVSK
jgi:hypothetical protein